MSSLLVGISVALVFIQMKRRARAFIDAKFDRCIRLLARVFDLRPKRQNRTSTNVERDAINWRSCLYHPVARDAVAGPEVVPCGWWEINGASGHSCFGHR